MKSVKKIIIILIILLIIITCILVGLILISQNTDKEDENTDSADYSVTMPETIQLVNDYNNYYTVNNAIVMYFNYVYEKNSEAILDILDEEYKENNSITQENVLEHVPAIEEEHFSFDMKEAYNKEDYQKITYCIYGQLNLLDSKKSEDYYLIVYTDTANMAYTINFITEDQYEKIINNEEELQSKDTIANNYNKLIYITVNEETIVTRLLYDYKQKVSSDPEEAYNLLNQEYREAKFSNLNEFNTYIQKSEISSAMLSQYEKQIKDNSTQYICMDQNNNPYIFEVTGIMKYTVILDTYTIDLPEFIEQYNSSDDANKVLLNIQKVFEAINDGDYKYVYNKLDSTFKQTNFPTLDVFTQYMENTYYKKNNIGYNSYQTSGNLHIYEIQATDANNAENPAVTKNFIMQLLEGTDFVMSFSV